MRAIELLEKKLDITDEERLELLKFIISWVGGTYMGNPNPDMVDKWLRIAALFPHKLSKPVSLMRLVTLPEEYANLVEFKLDSPAPNRIGSWTSTHFGIASVAGLADDIWGDDTTARIVIGAKIDPKNILVTPDTIKKAFQSLSYDYDYDIEKRYLGDEMIHDDLGYYKDIYDNIKGGPMRQYEYIVRTTPLKVRNIKVLSRGSKMVNDIGHDDPHNSGNYRGWKIY